MRRVLAAALLVAAAATAATATASRVVAQRFTFGGDAIGSTYYYGNNLLYPWTGIYNWRAPRQVPYYSGGNADTLAMLRTSVWSRYDYIAIRLSVKPGKYRVTLHFIETWATGPGQRLFNASVGASGTSKLPHQWARLDLFAAAGGRAYVPVDRTVDVTVPAKENPAISVLLVKTAVNFPCISGMTVEDIEGGGRATLSPSSSPSRATTTLSPLPSPAPTPTAMPTLNGTGAAAGGSPRRGALPRRGARL